MPPPCSRPLPRLTGPRSRLTSGAGRCTCRMVRAAITAALMDGGVAFSTHMHGSVWDDADGLHVHTQRVQWGCGAGLRGRAGCTATKVTCSSTVLPGVHAEVTCHLLSPSLSLLGGSVQSVAAEGSAAQEPTFKRSCSS